MRINKMITQVAKKGLDLLSNSLNSFFKEIYGDQFGEFVCGYWGLKVKPLYNSHFLLSPRRPLWRGSTELRPLLPFGATLLIIKALKQDSTVHF